MLENRIRSLEEEYQNSGLSFEIKRLPSQVESQGKLYINEGEKKRQEAERLNTLFRLCTVFMILTALASAALALYSWSKEQSKELSLWSLITVSVAISWPYVGADIAVGLGVLIFIMLTITFSWRSNA
jgi:hypothetical protein